METLLEREPFLASLAADLDAAAGGAGRTVVVSGEAGIGKTSLLERFLRDNGGARVLWGSCEALFTPHPLGPVHDFARDARGKLATAMHAFADRGVVFDAVLDELTVAPAPVVLVLEDIHWADDATLDLVKFLGRRIHRVPALLVLTHRDDEPGSAKALGSVIGYLPARHVTRLSLPPLSPAAVAALATRMRHAHEGLHAATAGNPFFVTEVLADPKGGVPATVRDAVLARASRLSKEARGVLEIASLVPRSIQATLLEAVADGDAQGVEECLASGIVLVEGLALKFRHELARAAVEESIPPARAKALHARLLAALSASKTPVAFARLVHHAHLAGDSAAVLRLAPQAAREAAARGARREAAAHGRAALELASSLGDAQRAALLEDYATHCFELGDFAPAIAAREEAMALFAKLHDPARHAASLARHAMALVRTLRNPQADEASQRAIQIAESLPAGSQRARAYAMQAWLRMLNRDCGDAIAWGEKAMALARHFDDDEVLVMAGNAVGAAMMFGDYGRGCAALAATREIAAGLDDGGVGVADGLMMLGTASGELFRLAEAVGYLDEGIAFARAHDLDRIGGYMEAWRSIVDVQRGQWDGVEERASALLAREPAVSTTRVTALVALGRLRTRRGDPGAQEVLDEALDLASRTASLQRIAPVCCIRAESAWLAGDPARAGLEARGAFDLAQAKAHPWFLGELAYWRWKAGELQAAPAGCAEPYALELGGRWQEAASAWEAIGCPYESARALLGGDEDARHRALATFDRLGAGPMAKRLRREMRAGGIQAIPRGPRASTRGNAAGLTSREVEVLELVARGWQNARIAQALSRSPRTVEHHVESILAKLGAGSRGEAVEAAREIGLLSQNGG
jgi:DNA-binding CsgD family transcriptional regulator/tetratricopeptide (TPR) repeat protein